jgi:hypothetical protein
MQFLRDGRCATFCVRNDTAALLPRVNAAIFPVGIKTRWQFKFAKCEEISGGRLRW